MNQLISGDSVAFQRQVAALSKTRLKLQVSAGVLIAIVSASHVLSGIMDGDSASKGLSLFGLAVGLYIAAHYSVLLKAKSALNDLVPRLRMSFRKTGTHFSGTCARPRLTPPASVRRRHWSPCR